MDKETVRNGFLERKRENQELLCASLKPGFHFWQVTASGEVDATEAYRDRPRKTIAEYQQAADILGPSA